MKNKKKRKQKDEKLKRVHRKSIMFNSKELSAINHYCRKYKIKNQSRFMRETIITAILKKFDEDYPSLFEDQPSSVMESKNNS
ncbi:MAG: hypothetical protein ACOCTM_00610 [Bacteroidota bacterium]